MWIVKRSTLLGWCVRHASAPPTLRLWLVKTNAATWRGLANVRRDFPQADHVPVLSGGPVYVFNIGSFRMVTAIHFNTAKVFLQLFLTHAEYDKGIAKKTDGKPGKWRDSL